MKHMDIAPMSICPQHRTFNADVPIQNLAVGPTNAEST